MGFIFSDSYVGRDGVSILMGAAGFEPGASLGFKD